MTLPVLDQWLVRRMGWTDFATPPKPDELRRWQLDQLNRLLRHARENSSFYEAHLKSEGTPFVHSFEDYARLPMLSTQMLRDCPQKLLCVSQDDIERIVTVKSSGTTGPSKRVFCTSEDLAATKDYFAWGMSNLTGPGESALVLMPGGRPGGVGDLLSDAIKSLGVRCVLHGEMQDSAAAVDHLLAEGATCLIGQSAHVNMVAREWRRRGLPSDRVRSVLLCWDVTPQAVVENVTQALGSRVFRHWGMVETGLGGAVECAPGSGLHLRETDVLVEIVDPSTGCLLLDGEFGEIVVTTLQRRGMPLIRYRTGDMARIMPGRCRCGSPMRRLDPKIRRLGDGLDFGTGFLRLEDLNEALYGLPEVDDFTAGIKEGLLHLHVCVERFGVRCRIIEALKGIPVVNEALKRGAIGLAIHLKDDRTPAVPGLGKRCFHEYRSS